MQSVSAELSAAILARQRQPLVRLRCDWDRSGSYTDLAVKDLSADVVSVDTSRELATDLPAEAKLFAGAASADATITLAHRDPAGDPTKHGAWYYSPLNSASPLFSYKRKGAPATLELGFVGTAGPEYVTVLTGSVRSMQVTSGGRQAVLRIADGAETMRKTINLPMVVADGESVAGAAVAPSLTTTWIADYIFRQCGWYASPPPRTGCMLSATMHGSGWPEIGTGFEIHGANNSPMVFSPGHTATAAQFVQGGHTATEIRYLLDVSTHNSSVNNGDEILFEGWFRFNSTSVNQPLFQALSSTGGVHVGAFWRQDTGVLQCTFNRGASDGSTNRVVLGPTISPGTSWHYYGIHAAFTSTQVSVTFRYDAATTGPNTQATASVTGTGDFNTCRVGKGIVTGFVEASADAICEAVQLTNEATPGTWNNTFVPTADVVVPVSSDDYQMAATPPVDSEEAWTLLQQVAEAEFCTTGFAETGRPFWYPYERWTTAPYTSSQRTLTSSNALAEVETVEAIDQVRNRIIGVANDADVQAVADIYRAPGRVWLAPSSTRSWWVQFDNPVANLDTSVTNGTTGATSRYLADRNIDGSGAAVTNLTFTITPYAQSALVEVVNPNAFDVFLVVDTGGTAGDPYFLLAGQLVVFDQATNTASRQDVSDATSVAAYDSEQVLELGSNPFRQRVGQLDKILADLLADLKDPGPALSNVPAPGDPRIQLGDRLTIVDSEGLVLSADFHVSRIGFSFSPSEGLSMTLTLRAA